MDARFVDLVNLTR